MPNKNFQIRKRGTFFKNKMATILTQRISKLFKHSLFTVMLFEVCNMKVIQDECIMVLLSNALNVIGVVRDHMFERNNNVSSRYIYVKHFYLSLCKRDSKVSIQIT